MCVNWRKRVSSQTGSSCTISPGGRRENRHGAGERKIELIVAAVHLFGTSSMVNRPSGVMGTIVRPGRVRDDAERPWQFPGNGRF